MLAFAAYMRPVLVTFLLGALAACDAVVAEEAKEEPAPKPKKAAPAPEPDPESEPVPEPEPADLGPKLPKTAASFDEAVVTAKEVHEEHPKTFFCGCSYTASSKVARGSCGYRTRADEILARKVAWDEVVPVTDFGAHRECWKTPMCSDENGHAFSGVRCCREKDPIFRAMEADLHNIVPVVAELEADRSNFPYGDVAKEDRLYGACDIEVDRSNRIVEPPEEVRGDIARIYMYMRDVYGNELPLTTAEIQMYEQWNADDPPSAWEVERNRRIAAIQGRANDHLPITLSAGDDAPPKPKRRKTKPAPEVVAGAPKTAP